MRQEGELRRLGAALAFILLSACSGQPAEPDFSWPAHADAIPDEHTAIMMSLAIFQGQVQHNVGDINELATRMEAFRYRRSDLVHDAKGDAWFVRPNAKENADFDKVCGGHCIGGDLYTMALSAHDGTVLEFYIPQ